MEQTIAFLGRQPGISLAELESVLGADSITRHHGSVAYLNTPADEFPGKRLGGTTKAVRILTTVKLVDKAKLAKFVAEAMLEHVADMPEGKVTIGFSDYGLGFNAKELTRLGTTVKSALKKAGRSVRHVPSKASTLSDAQVLHNKMTGPKGVEICLINDEGTVYVAQTIFIQDIEAYTRRDRNRPARDAKVGMLPPKLAQILINLAVGQIQTGSKKPKTTTKKDSQGSESKVTILDPFCGTGVLPQEATLMGLGVYGTDLEPRMIDYTQKNLDWIAPGRGPWQLEVGDARNHTWKDFTHVAAETYLGKPFFKLPPRDVLEPIISEVDKLHHDFLKNLATQTKLGTRICLGVPAWALRGNNFKHLPVLDSLEEIGYNRLDFVNTPQSELIYHRPGQVVARELLILERK